MKKLLHLSCALSRLPTATRIARGWYECCSATRYRTGRRTGTNTARRILGVLHETRNGIHVPLCESLCALSDSRWRVPRDAHLPSVSSKGATRQTTQRRCVQAAPFARAVSPVRAADGQRARTARPNQLASTTWLSTANQRANRNQRFEATRPAGEPSVQRCR